MSEETSSEGFRDGRGARTTRRANGNEDDKRGDVVTRRDNIGMARCRCNGEEFIDTEAMLSRAPLSTATASRRVDHGQ
uniref:Uncharacterized protein n=1 Tax=Oryza punctata TaxID=4537 RepID=A0A0E0JH65_ORYPU